MFTYSNIPSAAIAVVALICAAMPASSFANNSWGGYHWARTSNPFTLQLDNNVSGAAWNLSLAKASVDWTKSAVLDTRIVAGTVNPKNCRATAGRVAVCSSTYGKTGWLGVAQVWVSGTHITQGIVKVNDTYFNAAPYNTPAWRNLVMCQEVGHTLGLDHQNTIFTDPNLGTCMDYTNSPSGNEQPNQHDYDQLALIYNHLDSTTSVTSPALSNLDLPNPAQWGTLIRMSNRGWTEVYERDLGGGNKVFTFVIRAVDEALGRR